jgi:dihydroorotate dehydrogenase electron transfer subunit
MHSEAKIAEIVLRDGLRAARILCPSNLVPAAGQYLLAWAGQPASALASALFCAQSQPGGFLAAPGVPESWSPGMRLSLRGPLGRGFSPPASSRRVALAAPNSTPARLLPLIAPALERGAAVVLVCGSPPIDLSLAVEVHPVGALAEIQAWADYMAIDIPAPALAGLAARLGTRGSRHMPFRTQVLIQTPIACGGLAECGVCAVQARRGWKMACRNGPVFELEELA